MPHAAAMSAGSSSASQSRGGSPAGAAAAADADAGAAAAADAVAGAVAAAVAVGVGAFAAGFGLLRGDALAGFFAGTCDERPSVEGFGSSWQPASTTGTTVARTKKRAFERARASGNIGMG